MGGLFASLFASKITIQDPVRGTHRLTLRRRVAEGGFALVDLVQDERGVQYALKRLNCTEQLELEKAEQEILYYGRFHHKNLISIVASSKETKSLSNTEVLMLFPYFRGGTLLHMVERAHAVHQPLPEIKVLSVFLGICEGVKEIHDSNLAHRDLKLANVLFGEDQSTPVICDFGSMAEGVVPIGSRKEALALQDFATQNCCLPYRAPELLEINTGSTITSKTDIWSLGCLLYAMCYCATPFEYISGNGGSLPLAIAQGKIRISPLFQKQYSSGLQYLMHELLVVDPSSRPNIDQVLQKVRTLANSC